MPIKISINVGKIDKTALYDGKKGKYLNLVLWETPDDQYGNDYRVVQDLDKDRRDAGEKGAILGNAKNFGNAKPQHPTSRPPAAKRPPHDPDLDAPEDSIPF